MAGQDSGATSRNPSTGALIRTYPFQTGEEIEQVFSQSAAAYATWRAVPISERLGCYHRLAAHLRSRAEALAGLITAEMGKTVREARAEVEKTAATLEWIAEHGPAVLADEPAPTDGGDQAYVSYLAIGTVLAVMPWNLPVWQVVRAAGPIMLSGNGFLLKHAPNVMGCAFAKRLILEKPIAEAFTERFVAAARALKVGDPLDPSTDFGPIARGDLRDTVHDQVERSIRDGARLVLGGRKVDGPGFFYEATVLADVRPGMTCFEEEVFGPVASIIVAEDVEDAIRLTNASDYGLGGALWTSDLARARDIVRRLETGGVFINGLFETNPRIPVGGVKKSGYGRELSHFGLREFTNAQAVWIKTAA